MQPSQPGIGFRGSPRRAWVIGTGLDVWEVVDLVRAYSGDVAAIEAAHPLITKRHVQIAMRYAERFPDEVGAFMARQRRPLDQLRELYPFLQVAGSE